MLRCGRPKHDLPVLDPRIALRDEVQVLGEANWYAGLECLRALLESWVAP